MVISNEKLGFYMTDCEFLSLPGPCTSKILMYKCCNLIGWQPNDVIKVSVMSQITLTTSRYKKLEMEFYGLNSQSDDTVWRLAVIGYK